MIKLPESLTSIEPFAFEECTSLASIEWLPESLKSHSASYGFTSLASIKLTDSFKPSIGNSASNDASLTLNNITLSAVMELPESFKSTIGQHVFENTSSSEPTSNHSTLSSVAALVVLLLFMVGGVLLIQKRRNRNASARKQINEEIIDDFFLSTTDEETLKLLTSSFLAEWYG